MEAPSIVGAVIAFVVVSVLLLVGVQILGGTSTGFDCKTLTGYNSSGSTDAAKYPSGTWSGQCWAVQQQIQQSYGLLVVVLVIVAAAAILMVVRSFT